MNYQLRIVCLANSRKMSDRCVAGKTIDGQKIGKWIRPVTKRNAQVISLKERSYEDGAEAALLDIVEIPIVRPLPQTYQTENHLMDAKKRWTLRGKFPRHRLFEICDDVGALWTNGHSSSSGLNDRIPEREAKQRIDFSLALIRPENLEIIVQTGVMERRVRAEFTYRGTRYRLSVTDPKVERAFLKKTDGHYKIATKTAMCISIGEPFHNYCYKVAASIIEGG